MNSIFLVGLGGASGAIARHLINRLALHWPNVGFPFATLGVNVIGGCLMGVLVGWLAHKVDAGNDLRLLFGVGLLGGFTTFSAFSLELLQMIQRKAWGAAVVYSTGSVVVSVLALLLGLFVMRKIFAV